MNDAEKFVSGVEARVKHAYRSRLRDRMGRWKRQSTAAFQKVKRLFFKRPDSPEDPYSYVGAPRKPRLPRLSAAATAEIPED